MYYNLITKIKNNLSSILPITLVIILGLALRVYKINFYHFWRDEAFTWHTIQYGLNSIFEITKWDTHPPGYSFILYFWTRIFGETELGMRSLSLFFGVLAIFAMYLFSYKQTKSNWIATVTALLVATNPELIIYSQEARAYSIFLTIVIFLFYILSDRLDTKKSLIAAFIALIGLYTHSLFWLIVPLIYIWHWYFYGKNNFKYILILFSLTIAGYLPYIGLLSQKIVDKGSDFWLKFNPYLAIEENVRSFFTTQIYHKDYTWTPIIIDALLYTFYIGLILGCYQEYKNNRVRLAVIPIVFLVITFLISFYSPIFNLRYIQFIIPFVLLVAGIGFYRIYLSTKIISILFVTIIIASSIALYITDIKSTPLYLDYQKALTTLADNKITNILQPDPDITFDVIAFYTKKNNFQFNSLILEHPKLTKKQFQKGLIKPKNYIKNIKDLSSFVVITEDDNPYAKAYLNGLDFCLIKSEIIDKINLDYYEQCIM